MSSTNVYEDHLKSLLRFCSDFAEDINVPGEPAFKPVFFDAYEEFDQLPQGSLIGLAGYALDIDEHLVTLNGMIGVVTENDQNAFRLTKAMGKLTQRLLPTKRVTVFDAEGGDAIGQLTLLNGVRILPEGAGGGRTMKYLAFTATSDVTVDLSS
jgi:hypothetical protein